LGTDAAGRPFAEKVETLDVSRSGLHVRGLSVALKLEDTVSVSYKDQKARYHVKWLVPGPTAPGKPARWDAGLENPSPERNIFDFPLPTPILDNYAGLSSIRSGSGLPGGPTPSATGERRLLPRMRCVASAELHPDGQAAPIMAGIADVSLGHTPRVHVDSDCPSILRLARHGHSGLAGSIRPAAYFESHRDRHRSDDRIHEAPDGRGIGQQRAAFAPV